MDSNASLNREENLRSKFYQKLDTIFIIVFCVFYLFNFLGLKELTYLYGLFLALFSVMIFYLKPAEVLPYFFPFAMIEGQGRILWSYHPVARLVFDVFLLIVAFKAFYSNKKLIDTKAVPYYLYIFIILHFTWYFVQLFNPNAISLYAVLTATKIYIVPFILFFSFLTNPGLASDGNIKKIQSLVTLTLFLSSTLAIFQFFQGDSFITSINPYYKNILKDAFTGFLYRPFSTTHLPGGYASYLALFLPLLFITKKSSFLQLVIKIVLVILCVYAMFLSQVRSSLIKGILCIVLINLILFLRGEKKLKRLLSLILLVVTLSGISLSLNIEQFYQDDIFSTAVDRFLSIGDVKAVSSSRQGPDKAISFILHNLGENPIGLGPGRTGGVSTLHTSTIVNDPVYDLSYSWAWDNLYISLAIDFGIGMIFYLIAIFLVPIKLLNYTSRRFFSNSEHLPMITVSAITTMVILLGNWGGILLPYNPESFCFWYYGALGFKYATKRYT